MSRRWRIGLAVAGAGATALVSLAVLAQQGRRNDPGRSDDARVRALRDDYLRGQAESALQPAAPQSSFASCIREACGLGVATCTDQTDLLRIARACSGNYSGGCARAACTRLGTLACDEVGEVVEIASACRWNYGGSCLNTACALAGGLACNERETVLRLIRACAGNVGNGCLGVVCNRAGTMSCNSSDEVARVAEACGTGW